MRVSSVLAVFAAAFVTARANVSPEMYPEYYDTLEQAGVAAIQHAYDKSQFYEYGGVILQTTNGKYRVGVPETDYNGEGVGISTPHVDFAGYNVVADYHTHPCMPYSHWPRYFSDSDVGSNTDSGITGFMGDMCSGVVRRFIPAVTKEDKCWTDDLLEMQDGNPFAHCGSSGDDVGSIKLTRQPVIVEIPGPEALKRGMLSW
jgi:hypothetical protein